jgi:hypothetical protein
MLISHRVELRKALGVDHVSASTVQVDHQRVVVVGGKTRWEMHHEQALVVLVEQAIGEVHLSLRREPTKYHRSHHYALL